jgi:hypothetical protein
MRESCPTSSRTGAEGGARGTALLLSLPVLLPLDAATLLLPSTSGDALRMKRRASIATAASARTYAEKQSGALDATLVDSRRRRR